jgi:hypothetical protein
VEIIASGPGTFDGCAGYWHLGAFTPAKRPDAAQGGLHSLSIQWVKLVSGLVARRHVDRLRVIAMACLFLG